MTTAPAAKSPPRVAIEICVDSVASAVAADRAGADRVELCVDLVVGGVTPPASLLREVRAKISCALHVLVRPRPGDFHYSAYEIATMQRAIDEAKILGANGVVIGVLDVAGKIDVSATRELAKRARPMSITFHRAFDRVPSPLTALEHVITSGCDRLLTAGGAKPDGTEPTSAIDNVKSLRELIRAARNRTTILAAGGIRTTNVRDILALTGAPEIHSSLKPAHAPEDAALTESTVAQFISAAHTR